MDVGQALRTGPQAWALGCGSPASETIIAAGSLGAASAWQNRQSVAARHVARFASAAFGAFQRSRAFAGKGGPEEGGGGVPGCPGHRWPKAAHLRRRDGEGALAAAGTVGAATRGLAVAGAGAALVGTT